MIGLDQKRMIDKRGHQCFLPCIHTYTDAAPLQMLHDIRIDILWNTAGYIPGQHQNIILFQSIQLFYKLLQMRIANLRSLSVDFTFLLRMHLYVDSRKALLHLQKIRLNAHGRNPLFQCIPCKACDKAQCTGFHPKLCQHTGYIDSLSPEDQILRLGAHNFTGCQLVYFNHIVN